MNDLEVFARKCEIEQRLEPIKALLAVTLDQDKQMFSFGDGQPNAQRYVILPDRQSMHDLFGVRWSMQYSYRKDHKEHFGKYMMYETDLITAVLNYELEQAND